MSLLLTHGYYLSGDAREQKIMKPYPPLGLLYISAYLNSHGVENSVFDSTFYTREDQLEFIRDKKATVVAIYTNLMTKIEVVKLVNLLKSAEYGNPKIVLGGPDVSYNIDNYLQTGADYLIIGEGEQTMLELYRAIIQNEDLNEVSGIAYSKDGTIVKTLPRTQFRSLEDLPLPNRDAIPIEKYLTTWKRNHGQSSMTISTQRGCPYTCKWCSTAVYGQSYRRRPAAQVAAEMKMLKQKYNPDAIWFVDDVFTISHKWLTSFHDEVIRQQAQIRFECITRAERLNPEILKLLQEAGCFRIWIGAESGSQRIIDLMDRRVAVNHVQQMIRDTNAMGIETGTFIMVGYPGEDESDIRQTIRYLKQANPTHYTITVAYPIKGTPLYDEIAGQILKQPDWQSTTDREIDFKRLYPRKYYDYAVSKVVHEVESYRAMVSKSPFKALKHKARSLLAGAMMALSK